jgi:hypothetical protein
MRNYERGPDGVWHDGLLMDMLKEEFCPDRRAYPIVYCTSILRPPLRCG